MDDTEEVIAHYVSIGRPTRLERRIPAYFAEWARLSRQEEEVRAKQKDQPAEFKALGGGGEEDKEAWDQWFEYVEWVAEGQPDELGAGGSFDDYDDDRDDDEDEDLMGG